MSPPALGRPAALLATAALLAAVAPPDLSAQAHVSAVPVDSLRRIQSIEPRTGPPGTRVEIYTENLPLQGKVVLGVGAIHAGFEALAEAEQGALGEVGGTVRIPESAGWDRPLVLITFNGNFAPTALSDPFHVTDAEGHIFRTGEITDEGEGCVAMRDADGYFYTLTGDVGEPEPGQAVAVEGTFVATGACAQGETIRVTRLHEPAGTPPGGEGR